MEDKNSQATTAARGKNERDEAQTAPRPSEELTTEDVIIAGQQSGLASQEKMAAHKEAEQEGNQDHDKH